jgi:type II secretory ATPase GspE/PulE/Tfp pilus assembly ATPase PilB-like protein
MAKERTKGRRAALGEFVWPAPPYHEYIDDDETDHLGECLLILNNGARMNGALLSFSAEEEKLVFRADGARSGTTVVFADLLRMRMLQALALRRERVPGIATEEAAPRAERLSFRIDLANGQVYKGVTLGHVSALCGLFLFLVMGNGSVVRVFIPSGSVKECSIGAPIGQMLVEQNAVSEEAVAVALNMQSMMRTQKLGTFLTGQNLVSKEQLSAALELKKHRPDAKLGEVLMELGYVTRPELEIALDTDARERKMPVGEILSKKMGIVDERAINETLANQLGMPPVKLDKVVIEPGTLRRIPAVTANSHRIVPLYEKNDALVVACEAPPARHVIEEIQRVAGLKVMPVIASADDISQTLQRYYVQPAAELRLDAPPAKLSPVRGVNRPRTRPQGAVPDDEGGIHQLMSRLSSESGRLDVAEQQAIKSDSVLVQFVNRMILDAVEQKASDIHIEANPSPKNTRVRFRKDGTLVDYLELPSQFRNAAVSRIKIMSQLDITERRKPQDGKIDFSRFAGVAVELRVATVPTTSGLEDVVMRVLTAARQLPLDELGLDEKTLVTITRLIGKPHGLFIVCGPTGSGKTTTLHSLLSYLNTAERKIWTAEDPIEITQSGLRQVQVNAKIGWTFAAAMRSFMRADPDVIMVGEMRDAETAKIGIEASLTGHLVLTTLHTNSAPESLVRLLDLGMDPFNFADALLGVLAERLIKRLCPDCREDYEPDDTEMEELLAHYCADSTLTPEVQMAQWRERYGDSHGRITLHRAHGCERCNNTGYRGRIPVYELLVADAAQKRLVQSRATVTQIKEAALVTGMRTLAQNGIEKVLEGLTDIYQVRNVSG